MYAEDEKTIDKTRFKGFDNSKPAPWQDPNNIKEIRRKYALPEENTYR